MLKVIAIIAAFMAAACTTATVQPEHTRRPHETALVFASDTAETADAYQGQFTVPENRQDASSRMLTLHYVRFPATGKHPGPPIVYLAGGPGGSGIATARWRRFPLFMAMREFGDVIAFEQRGTGLSDDTPRCQSSQIVPADQAMPDAAFIALHQQALHECLGFWQQLDIDIRGYTTPESVADLDALRRHLGAEKLSLWGISYGSHLALAALKAMDDRIERVVIASVEGLDQTVKLPARTDAYFQRLQQAIDKQPAAKAVFPDIHALIRRVHDKLDAAPMMLEVPQENGATVNVLLQRRDMQQIASGMISDPPRAKLLLQAYAALDRGDTGPITAIVQRGDQPGAAISMRAMPYGMDLASGIGVARRKLVEEQAQTALLGSYLNFTLHLTDVAPFLDLGDAFRTAPRSNVPVLVLSGTLDGRTYIESQHEAVAGLANRTEVTVVNAGHNLFMSSPKVGATIAQFMRGEPVTEKVIEIDLPDFAGE